LAFPGPTAYLLATLAIAQTSRRSSWALMAFESNTFVSGREQHVCC
jgi:hypothetical protein